MNWVNVKDRLPTNDTYVTVKMRILWKTQKSAIYINKYFVRKGENITKWVTHWKPLLERSK